MENQELRQQYENYCKELKEKITDLKLENERLQRENELWKTYKEPKRDLELEIAILQDQLEFASEQADTFAKSLKGIYDEIEEFETYSPDINEFLSQRELNENVDLSILKNIKNSIPENALKRAE